MFIAISGALLRFASRLIRARPAKERRPAPARAAAAGSLCAMLLLNGCASLLPVPRGQAPVSALPRQVHVVIQTAGAGSQDAILVVQNDGAQALRWSLMNPLGAPLARQILEAGRWRNDGFLPPNGAASSMFSALIFAWTPQAALAERYPEGNWRLSRDGGVTVRTWGDSSHPGFVVRYPAGAAGERFSITHGELTWHVSPLPESPK